MSRKQRKRLIRLIAAAVLLVIVSFLPVLNERLRFALFLIPYLVVGYDVLWTAVRHIVHGQLFDEQFLMTVATFGAFGLHEYREAVAVMLFYQIGELFQSIAVGKSRKNIAALMDIRPDSATVLRNGQEVAVSPEEVEIGECFVVRPGEKIPLDGVIVKGSTSVSTAALTGESLPQDKTAGDRVVSGSVNQSGVITVKAESTFGESTVVKILDLVENASSKKARTENFITRFAKYYTPCVVAAAVLLAVIPSLFMGGFAVWLRRALIFLVVSCPCALVISVPLSFFGGIGGASKQGILIKGSNYLEILARAGVVVMDKTGTLTEGVFRVTAVHPENVSEAELLDIAAAAESYSNHPIAESIVAAHGGHLEPSRLTGTTEHAGLGVEALVDGKRFFIGNDKLMRRCGADYHDCHLSGTVIHVAQEGQYLGHIVISDQVKADSKAAIAELKGLGIAKTVMLTGDRKEIAESVARELQIDEVAAELLPGDKVAAVEKYMAAGLPLAFVGDGVNDAPVLARADVSVAMGALGSDAAIEAADIVLMDDKPSKLPVAVRLSRRTMRIVKENIVFALAVKAAVLLLAAAGFASMWTAVFADVGVAVLAILNAMRAMKVKG